MKKKIKVVDKMQLLKKSVPGLGRDYYAMFS